MAQSVPGIFTRQFPPPVLIDKFQYAPDILPYIKVAVGELGTRSRNRQAAGLYGLTGSQHFGLMKSARESLAGRVTLLERIPENSVYLERCSSIYQLTIAEAPIAERHSPSSRWRGNPVRVGHYVLQPGSVPACAGKSDWRPEW